MSLRYALLGALAKAPASGYDLVKRFDKAYNKVWWASHGAVYTELQRLVAEGLVTASEGGARRKMVHQTTAEGLSAVREWLASPLSRRPRDDWVLRVFFLWVLPPSEAAAYLERLGGEFGASLEEYEARAARFPDPDALDDHEFFDFLALQVGIAHERAMATWAVEAARAVRRRAVPT
jgi:DNA-binding PadR family transcriptional regulator